MAPKSKKNQLAKLKEEDPDFYTFVASKGLLDLSNNFDESDDEVYSDGVVNEADEETVITKTSTKADKKKIEVGLGFLMFHTCVIL